MSIDFQLAFRCPHLVIEEPVGISLDRRSLLPTAPVGSTTLLRVLANNEFYIPPTGLFSQASLKGAISGPFAIEGCVSENGVSVDSNVLTVSSSSETHTFRLPTGNRVQTDTLVRLFRDSFGDIVVSNDNGYLVFLDVAHIGPESFIKVSGRATSTLGFGFQRAAYGKEIYPGWTLEKRSDILPRVNRNGQVISYARYPKFRKPVHKNPTYKVTYVSTPDRCPRCSATFIENDWRFNPQGELITIINEDLLYQAALKILLTKRGSNPFHSAYGSKMLDRIGAKAIGATATLIREDVVTALQRMQGLQGQQVKFQRVEPRERLASILSVEVRPHRSDQTAFLVDVTVSNNSGLPVQISVVFAVPGAIALAGSNNLTLGLDTTGLTTEQSRRFLT